MVKRLLKKGRVKKIDIKDLRDESRHEGMSGISTRFIMKALDSALTDSTTSMITPISVMDSLIKQVKEQVVNDEFRNTCLELLQKIVREEYLKILEKRKSQKHLSQHMKSKHSHCLILTLITLKHLPHVKK